MNKIVITWNGTNEPFEKFVSSINGMIEEAVNIHPPEPTIPLAEMSVERNGVEDDPVTWVAPVAE